jgi:hypothetical protein
LEEGRVWSKKERTTPRAHASGWSDPRSKLFCVRDGSDKDKRFFQTVEEKGKNKKEQRRTGMKTNKEQKEKEKKETKRRRGFLLLSFPLSLSFLFSLCEARSLFLFTFCKEKKKRNRTPFRLVGEENCFPR